MENQRINNSKENVFSSFSRAIRRRLSRAKSSDPHPIDDTLVITEPPNSIEERIDTTATDGHAVTPAAPHPGTDSVAAAELIHFHQSAVSLLHNNNIYVNFSTPAADTMANERRALAKYGWYWGSISVKAAQKKLNGRPNGSFLVRDSHTGPFQFSISFRSAGCTLHTRIDFISGYWTIFTDRRYRTMVDLIEDTMREEKIYYVPSTQLRSDFPFQLRHPVSRFVNSSLQHLCREAIRSHLEKRAAPIDQLPLPKLLIDYLMEVSFDSL